MDPLQCLSLIEKTRIQSAPGSHLFAGEEAKTTHSVIDLNSDDVIPRSLDEVGEIQVGVRQLGEATTRNVEQDG